MELVSSHGWKGNLQYVGSQMPVHFHHINANTTIQNMRVWKVQYNGHCNRMKLSIVQKYSVSGKNTAKLVLPISGTVIARLLRGCQVSLCGCQYATLSTYILLCSFYKLQYSSPEEYLDNWQLGKGLIYSN